MSHLAVRILLTVFMLPIAVVVYVATILIAEGAANYGYYNNDRPPMFLAAAGVTWVFVAVTSILIWRKAIRWTPQRTWVPVVAAIAGCFIAAISLFTLSQSGEREVHEILVGILVPMLWLIVTVLSWRETNLERADRLGRSGQTNVVCPRCGYNLMGLSEARCPECGAKFTLDELLAGQPGRSTELE